MTTDRFTYELIERFGLIRLMDLERVFLQEWLKSYPSQPSKYVILKSVQSLMNKGDIYYVRRNGMRFLKARESRRGLGARPLIEQLLSIADEAEAALKRVGWSCVDVVDCRQSGSIYLLMERGSERSKLRISNHNRRKVDSVERTFSAQLVLTRMGVNHFQAFKTHYRLTDSQAHELAKRSFRTLETLGMEAPNDDFSKKATDQSANRRK